MLKSISWIVAFLIAAPMLPAQANGISIRIGAPVYRSTFRNSTFGYGSINPYRHSVIYQQPYYPYYPNQIVPTYPYQSPRVILTPRVRTVIINPGYSYDRSNCGTVIYGSPIVSPIPVNPYTGLACR